jgi:hypothetical protein
MLAGESGILDGRITGNRVSFTTKHKIEEWVKGLFTGTYKDFITSYQGEIKRNEIHFVAQTEYRAANSIAKKVVDKTEIMPSNAQKAYVLAYDLPGHEGGVQSLSFGPDQGLYRLVGLRRCERRQKKDVGCCDR